MQSLELKIFSYRVCHVQIFCALVVDSFYDYAVVTCEINYFEIISLCFVSRVTTSGIVSKLFQLLNFFEIISATLNALKNIRELQ